jgi:hypothetical protein
MAGFELTLHGRFWVTPEGAVGTEPRNRHCKVSPLAVNLYSLVDFGSFVRHRSSLRDLDTKGRSDFENSLKVVTTVVQRIGERLQVAYNKKLTEGW